MKNILFPGGPTWVRTRGLPVMSRWLFQLSYGPILIIGYPSRVSTPGSDADCARLDETSARQGLQIAEYEFRGAFNNYQFVISAPYWVRGGSPVISRGSGFLPPQE
jgi:hypothetical protein